MVIGVKLSQINNGGNFNTATDKLVVVRNGTTDELVALSQAILGGPFLPLSGGTVTGDTYFTATTYFSGPLLTDRIFGYDDNVIWLQYGDDTGQGGLHDGDVQIGDIEQNYGGVSLYLNQTQGSLFTGSVTLGSSTASNNSLIINTNQNDVISATSSAGSFQYFQLSDSGGLFSQLGLNGNGGNGSSYLNSSEEFDLFAYNGQLFLQIGALTGSNVTYVQPGSNYANAFTFDDRLNLTGPGQQWGYLAGGDGRFYFGFDSGSGSIDSNGLIIDGVNHRIFGDYGQNQCLAISGQQLINSSNIASVDWGNDILAGTWTIGNIIDSGLTASTMVKANASKQLVSAVSGTDYTPGVMTTLGDIIYENATPAPARLAGNTTSTKKFLTQTGTGAVSSAPGWNTIAAADLPAAVPQIVGNDRKTALTAAQALATYTVGAADATFQVSANVNVTAVVAASFQVTCAYTDETNTSRTLVLNFSQVSGTFVQTLTAALGAGAYEGVPLQIRAKAGTTIIIASTGTFTSVTYNLEERILSL